MGLSGSIHAYQAKTFAVDSYTLDDGETNVMVAADGFTIWLSLDQAREIGKQAEAELQSIEHDAGV